MAFLSEVADERMKGPEGQAQRDAMRNDTELAQFERLSRITGKQVIRLARALAKMDLFRGTSERKNDDNARDASDEETLESDGRKSKLADGKQQTEPVDSVHIKALTQLTLKFGALERARRQRRMLQDSDGDDDDLFTN